MTDNDQCRWLRFFVPGHPRTKGSLTPKAPRCHCCDACKGYVGKPQLSDSAASKRWRQLVAYQAQNAMHYQAVAQGYEYPVSGPVSMRLIYWMPPLTLGSDPYAQGIGDIDKLERNIFDALQDAGFYRNDAQVVRCDHERKFAGAGVEAGVWVDAEWMP